MNHHNCPCKINKLSMLIVSKNVSVPICQKMLSMSEFKCILYWSIQLHMALSVVILIHSERFC